MWACGAVAYFVAVFHRTSLGVAAGDARERFHIGATELSFFTLQQLVVYAMAQLPAGALADRFGPRRMFTVALCTMAAGQMCFAVAESYPLALMARSVIGCGDALTFVSALRLTVAWCPERWIALLVQLTSVLGMAGNLASTAPLSAALNAFGWTRVFLAAALATAVSGAVVNLVVRDAPSGSARSFTEQSWSSVFHAIREVWQVAGTRLGMWIHFTTAFSFLSFTLLWGFPFLTRGCGVSESGAAVLLMLMVIINMVTGPVVGLLTARRPGVRVPLSVGVVAVVVTLWLVTLAWPAQVPTSVLVALVVVLGVCGPASMVGVDIARTSNTTRRVASAAATANLGGLAGALISVLLIGVVLDLTDHLDARTAFRAAMATQFLPFALGAARIMRWARREPR